MPTCISITYKSNPKISLRAQNVPIVLIVIAPASIGYTVAQNKQRACTLGHVNLHRAHEVPVHARGARSERGRVYDVSST
jgi:hypothetical protein